MKIGKTLKNEPPLIGGIQTLAVRNKITGFKVKGKLFAVWQGDIRAAYDKAYQYEKKVSKKK